jgi:hypothetical protein
MVCGDLFIYCIAITTGWYEKCLLCGYQRDVPYIIAETGGRLNVNFLMGVIGLYEKFRANGT